MSQSQTQKAFLAFHARHACITWQWLFQGSTLRARTEGDAVTISAAEFVEMVDAGLCEPIGAAGVRLTGRATA